MKKSLFCAILSVALMVNIVLIYLICSNNDFDDISYSPAPSISQSDILSRSDEPIDDGPALSDEGNFDMNVPAVNMYAFKNINKNTGNLAANIYNGGIIAQGSNKNYYLDVNNTGYILYNQEKLTDYVTLQKTDASSVNFYKDTIYYLDNNEGCIYKASSSDNQSPVKLGGNSPSQLIVENNFIYYLSSVDENGFGSIHRMELDGSNDTKITDPNEKYKNIAPFGDVMFAIRKNKNTSSICCINLNDGSVSILYTGNVSDLNCYSGNIRFIRHKSDHDEICSVSRKSSEITQLYSGSSISNLIVDGTYMYFILNEQSKQLIRMSIKSGRIVVVYDNADNPINSFNLASNFAAIKLDNEKGLKKVYETGTTLLSFPICEQ